MTSALPDLKLYQKWKAEWTSDIRALYEDNTQFGRSRKDTINKFSGRLTKDLIIMLGKNKKVITEARQGGLVALEQYVKPPLGSYFEMRIRSIDSLVSHSKMPDGDLILIRVNDLTKIPEAAITTQKHYIQQLEMYFSDYGSPFKLSFH